MNQTAEKNPTIPDNLQHAQLASNPQKSSLSKILRLNGKNRGSGTGSANSSNTKASTMNLSRTSSTGNMNNYSATTNDSNKTSKNGKTGLPISSYETSDSNKNNSVNSKNSTPNLRKVVMLNNFQDLKSSIRGISDECKYNLYGTKKNIYGNNDIDEQTFGGAFNGNSETQYEQRLRQQQQHEFPLNGLQTSTSMPKIHGFRLIVASENGGDIGMNNYDIVLDKTASTSGSNQESFANETPFASSYTQKSSNNTQSNNKSNVATLISQKELKEYIFGSPIRYMSSNSKNSATYDFNPSSKLINNTEDVEQSRDHNVKIRVVKIPMYEPLVLVSTLSVISLEKSKTSVSVSVLMSSRYLPFLLEGWNNGLYFWFKNVQHKFFVKYMCFLQNKINICQRLTSNTKSPDCTSDMFIETDRIFNSFIKNFIPNLMSYYQVPRLFISSIDDNPVLAFKWFKKVHNWLLLKDDGHNRLMHILIKVLVDYKKLKYNEVEIQRVLILSNNFSIANKLIYILSAVIPDKINTMEIVSTEKRQLPICEINKNEGPLTGTSSNSSSSSSIRSGFTGSNQPLAIPKIDRSGASSPSLYSRSPSTPGGLNNGLAIPTGNNKKSTYSISRQNSGVFHSTSFNEGTSKNYLSSSLSSSIGSNSWFGSIGSGSASSNSPISEMFNPQHSSSGSNNGNIFASPMKRPVMHRSESSTNSLLHVMPNGHSGYSMSANNACVATTPDCNEHQEYAWNGATKGSSDVKTVDQSFHALNLKRSASRFDDKMMLDNSVSNAFNKLIGTFERSSSKESADELMKIKLKQNTHADYLEIESLFLNTSSSDMSSSGYYRRQIPERLTSYHSTFNPNFQLQAIPYSKYSEIQLIKTMKMDLKILQDKKQCHENYCSSCANSEPGGCFSKGSLKNKLQTKCLLITLPTNEVKEYVLEKALTQDTSRLVKQRCIKFLHSNGKYNYQSNAHLDEPYKHLENVLLKAFKVVQDIESANSFASVPGTLSRSTLSETLDPRNRELQEHVFSTEEVNAKYKELSVLFKYVVYHVESQFP